MTRRSAMALASLLALAACEAPGAGPSVFVSPAYDQAWTQQRRYCEATPQAAHCDIYLRNAVPPAPYSTDGILVEQRRLCFATRSVGDCTLALTMGRQAARTAGAGSAPAAEDEDTYARVPAVASEPSYDAAPEPEPAPAPRQRRRAPALEATAQCTPAALDALDLVEAPVRAAILRRCGTARR